MQVGINFKQDQIWRFDGQVYRFLRQSDGDVLQLQNERTGDLLKVETERGEVRLPSLAWASAEFAAGRLVRPPAPNRNRTERLRLQREQDALEIYRRDPKAKMRGLIVRELDKLEFISNFGFEIHLILRRLWRLHPTEAAAFSRPPHVSTVRRWWLERGVEGERTARSMLNMKGRSPRASKLNPLIQNWIGEACELYWSKQNWGVGAACDHVRSKVGEHNDTTHCQLLRAPSRETVRRAITRRKSYQTMVSKYGRHYADMKMKASGRGLVAHHILEIIVMDHTPVDVMVIDIDNRLPLGRPYLTVMIDVYSRCVISFVLSFEPPSLYSITECIKRGNRPKREPEAIDPVFSRLNDIFGRPGELLIDNGWEFAGSAFEDALADSGITLRLAPIKTPEFKAIGERFFETLNSKLFDQLGGATLSPKALKDLDIDPSKTAVLTLHELEHLIWNAICVYHFDEHRTLGAPPGSVWMADAAKRGIDVIGDDSELDKMLGAVKTGARLSRGGVQFQNLRYSDPGRVRQLLDDLVALEPKRNRPSGSEVAKVKFKYNPADLSQIHVWNERRNEYVSLPCLYEDYSKNLSVYQHKRFQDYAEARGIEFSSEKQRLEVRQNFRELIDSFAGDLKIRQRRVLERIKNSPTVNARIELSVAEARHDGLSQIIDQEPLAASRNDGGLVPTRPSRGGKSPPPAKKRHTPPSSSTPVEVWRHEPEDDESDDWKEFTK